MASPTRAAECLAVPYLDREYEGQATRPDQAWWIFVIDPWWSEVNKQEFSKKAIVQKQTFFSCLNNTARELDAVLRLGLSWIQWSSRFPSGENLIESLGEVSRTPNKDSSQVSCVSSQVLTLEGGLTT